MALRTVLLVYDVGDRRALRRVARLASAFGVRVQKSVFECALGPREVNELVRRLEAERESAEGTFSARLYVLPRAGWAARTVGDAEALPAIAPPSFLVF